MRFGLAISKETPNILSQDKVNRFFCSTVFSYPDDYKKRAIFGDYPYRFNISLLEVKENKYSFCGGQYVRKLRNHPASRADQGATSNARLQHHNNNTYCAYSGDNETQHEFSILINNTGLLHGAVRNPAYQINPAREYPCINITDINSTMYPIGRIVSISVSPKYMQKTKNLSRYTFSTTR